MNLRVWPGRPYPLGATWDGGGTNFAIYSEHATRVDLCLFDSAEDARETTRIPLPEQTDMVWHGYFPDVVPGQIYGYRIDGPYLPKEGHRFNANKILLDPYAKSLGRAPRWSDTLWGYRLGDAKGDLSFDDRDDARFAPLAAVLDEAFTWGDDRPPRIPWNKTILYETHVKGLTQLHPGVPEKLRGTYAGLGSDAVIRHLKSLGVTAVELLPVHEFMDDRVLVDRGLVNYWGYNTMSFFSPARRYAAGDAPGDAVREFKTMVRTLHAAEIEVILDVVYNHTAEGNQLGPTLTFRGIDNAAYYRLMPEDPRYYMDFTGCGNTFNMQNPRVLQLIMDSLRYWIVHMHVDGFRFDLASTLARELHEVNKLGAFFDIIHQDPVISQVKLIAEPWDLGEGGYQVGNFPILWSEWNGKYRDCVRHFWKGDPGYLAEFATRFCGSSDLYEWSSRRPHASINFVTAHDGFSLHDLVSYDRKHNEPNGENNRDGSDDNISWNCGAEGLTDDRAILSLRERKMRCFLATLLLSQGAPMLRAGDEIINTQKGNNNAYCQDNVVSWLDWDLDVPEQTMLKFTQYVGTIVRNQPVFHRRRFFHRDAKPSPATPEISWYDPTGAAMSEATWKSPTARSLGVVLYGSNVDVDEHGEAIHGDTLLLLFNADQLNPIAFTLPPPVNGTPWERILDTAETEYDHVEEAGKTYMLKACSIAIFCSKEPEVSTP